MAGGADLAIHGEPSVVADGARGCEFAADCVGQLFGQVDIFLLLDAASDGDDDLGLGQIDGLLGFFENFLRLVAHDTFRNINVDGLNRGGGCAGFDFIRAEVPLLKRLSPEAFKNCLVAFGARSSNYGVSGVYASYGRMRKMDVAEGAFFNEADDFTHTRVAVIGSDAKKKLFSGQTAIGENIRVDGISYQIVGILKHQVQNGDDNINEHVYVPYSAMSDLTNTYYLSSVVMEYEGDHAKIVKAVRESMAFHHGFNPKDQRAIFVFDVFADLMDLQVISTGIKILLGFIGLLTLGIGGVGLMNIMLVSVTQRTREIGVEKALGAHRWHILFQFLAEALVITALGGLLGVILAYLVSWSVGSLTLWSAFEENASEGDIHLYIDSATLIWSTAILSFVGIISGMLPAIKAARLNPIEALRYE